jgi:hypothetical protein
MENKALKIGIYTADFYGGNSLLDCLIKGLKELGHQCVPFDKQIEFDYVIVFAVAAPFANFNKNLKYSNLDLIQSKIIFIDTGEYGWWTHYDEQAEFYYNAFATGGQPNLGYVPLINQKGPTHLDLLNFLRGKSFPYFLREMYKIIPYPEQYHPIDYTLHWTTPIPKENNFEEYMGKKYDIFSQWGGSHPFRHNLIEKMNSTLLGDKICINKVRGILKPLERGGQICNYTMDKLPQLEYFSELTNARMSLVYDGFGSGSFREMEVLSRCLLFIHKQCIYKRHPLTFQGEGQNAVEYEVEYKFSPYLTFIDSNIVEQIQKYMSDWELCFKIYKAGYEHCLKYYTPKGVAEYVLEETLKHDYRVPTPVEGFVIRKGE